MQSQTDSSFLIGSSPETGLSSIRNGRGADLMAKSSLRLCRGPASTHLMVLSDDPLTTSRSLYCRQAMPRLCPFRVRTNSQVLVLQTCKRPAVFYFILFYLILFLRVYLFIFREGKGRKEREKHPCVVASRAPPTGDLTCNPGMYPDWESHRRPIGS